jgi:hypothetical protein
MSDLRSKLSLLSGQTRWEIVQYAFFRWENAVIVAGTILLSAFYPKPLPWWPVWGWLLLGLVGLAAITFSSLTSREANARLLLKLFQDQYNPRAIKNPELRQRVTSALEYQRRIDVQVRRRQGRMLWEKPEDVAEQVKDWIGYIYQLATRLDAYRQDTLLEMQRDSVPKEIAQLTVQRQKETNPVYQQELDQVLESKRKHLETLQALEMRMKQAEYQMEQSLSALATVDSQIQLIDAQAVESGRSERLLADIQEQVNRLNDLVGSINEVYQQNNPQVAA